MKSNEKILNELIHRIQLGSGSGTWSSEEDKFKNKGYIKALKWVILDKEEANQNDKM